MQPHNHLLISRFVLDESYAPTLARQLAQASTGSRSPRSRDRSPSPPRPLLSASALSAPAVNPATGRQEDQALLATIAKLERLRRVSNISGFLRQTGFADSQEAELIEEGKAICVKLGIPVAREWQADWWTSLR